MPESRLDWSPCAYRICWGLLRARAVEDKAIFICDFFKLLLKDGYGFLDVRRKDGGRLRPEELGGLLSGDLELSWRRGLAPSRLILIFRIDDESRITPTAPRFWVTPDCLRECRSELLDGLLNLAVLEARINELGLKFAPWPSLFMFEKAPIPDFFYYLPDVVFLLLVGIRSGLDELTFVLFGMILIFLNPMIVFLLLWVVVDGGSTLFGANVILKADCDCDVAVLGVVVGTILWCFSSSSPSWDLVYISILPLLRSSLTAAGTPLLLYPTTLAVELVGLLICATFFVGSLSTWFN